MAEKAAPSYGSLKPVLGLAVATVSPLVITLAPKNLVTLTVGCGLAAALVRMTLPPATALKTSDDKAEARAARDVIMTSSSNRTARVALGLVYLYAGATFALRWLVPDGVSLRPRLMAGDASAFGLLSVAWSGCMVDNYIAGIWLSTGVDGQ